MSEYKCKNCGYDGDELIFQFIDYTYCVATNNKEEPEFIDSIPKWVEDKGVGETDIGEPVGCPKCKVWGVHNFS